MQFSFFFCYMCVCAHCALIYGYRLASKQVYSVLAIDNEYTFLISSISIVARLNVKQTYSRNLMLKI